MNENQDKVAIKTVTLHTPCKRRRRLIIAFVLFGILVFLLWFIGVLGGNVRAVVPGVMYRSAQITGNNYTSDTAHWLGHGFSETVKKYHIKTDINLRGGGMNNDYYRDEIRDCKKLGVDHVDISMSARHLPPPSSLKELLDVFDHDPYPMIFHCQGGSDRSGLVGTLYLALYRNVPLNKAEDQQLTMRYGHFGFTSTGAMNNFFDMYRKTADGMPLRQWILQSYPRLYAKISNP